MIFVYLFYFVKIFKYNNKQFLNSFKNKTQRKQIKKTQKRWKELKNYIKALIRV